MAKRVLIGMSGGIDSTVAAILLLEQGYELVGATFRTFDVVKDAEFSNTKGCCSEDSITSAQKMAQLLGIEHHVLDFRDTFHHIDCPVNSMFLVKIFSYFSHKF